MNEYAAALPSSRMSLPSAAKPLRVIRYPHPVCWGVRDWIEGAARRERVERIAAAALAAPVLLPVPRVALSPGR